MKIKALDGGAFRISELTDEEAQVLIQAGIDSTISKDFNSEKYFNRLKELVHDDLEEDWDDELPVLEDRGEGM